MKDSKEKSNILADVQPDLAREWDYDLNGNLTPYDVTIGSGKTVYWTIDYFDEELNKSFVLKWDDKIINRTKRGSKCPYLTGKRILKGFNDLSTRNPELAAQWHPTKNGDVTAQDVSCGCNTKYWWYLHYFDEFTGKWFDFEWEESVNNRNKGRGCPYLSGHKLYVGFNDLGTKRPDIAKQWHPTLNGDKKPIDVMEKSNDTVYWLYPYDDPNTGKHFDFVWRARISNRTFDNTDCPYLSNQKVQVGFNDLATLNKPLAKQWHPTKNGTLTPKMVSSNYNKKVWWSLDYLDPKTKEVITYEWQASVVSRNAGEDCPFIKESKGEQIVSKTLRSMRIKTERQKQFDDCRSTKKLSFDFYLPNYKIAIEYDGLQHFEKVDFFGGEQSFKDTYTRDNIKNEYCFTHGIRLLRIPYFYSSDIEIRNIIKNFIKFVELPDIKNFYDALKFSNYGKVYKDDLSKTSRNIA